VSSNNSSHTAGRSRRRLAAWLAFGAVGLATGAVWATGFTSMLTTTSAASVAAPLTKAAPDVATSTLDGVVANDTVLNFAWAGRWGSVVSTNLFTVDLGDEPVGNHYNLALLLANTPALTGWASLQLEFEKVALADGGVCSAGDFDGTKDPKLMNFDNVDAGVYWNVTGDAVYCLGVFASDGNDVAATFLRSATDTAPSVLPEFITTVDRAS
jgi:hypothetical protein